MGIYVCVEMVNSVQCIIQTTVCRLVKLRQNDYMLKCCFVTEGEIYDAHVMIRYVMDRHEVIIRSIIIRILFEWPGLMYT